MGSLEFGYGELRTYLPQHEGIDWHEVYERNHPDEEDMPLWGETIDELGEFCEQLHQENLFFWLNDTDPTFDVLVVRDHRDESGDWWFSRGQLGDDFEGLVQKMGGEATIIKTKYPTRHVAQYVLKFMELDVEQVEHIPDEWQ